MQWGRFGLNSPGNQVRQHKLLSIIHGSPGTEIPGIGTEIGVFGHVWRYFYRIGTGDSDFLSSGLESVSVDCDILSTGMYILHTTYALWALSKRKQLFLMWLDHSQDKPQVSLVSLQSTNQQYRNLSSFLLNSDSLPVQVQARYRPLERRPGSVSDSLGPGH